LGPRGVNGKRVGGRRAVPFRESAFGLLHAPAATQSVVEIPWLASCRTHGRGVLRFVQEDNSQANGFEPSQRLAKIAPPPARLDDEGGCPRCIRPPPADRNRATSSWREFPDIRRRLGRICGPGGLLSRIAPAKAQGGICLREICEDIRGC
jgi:hypothetical protein